MTLGLLVLVLAIGFVAVVLAGSIRVVKQFERGVVFRFGRVDPRPRRPGLCFLMPLRTSCRR